MSEPVRQFGKMPWADPCRNCVHAPHNRTLTKIGMWGPIGAIAGVGALGVLNIYTVPPWVIDMTRSWGPGFLMVTILMSAVAYYFPRESVPHFVQSQIDQAVALSGVAEQMRVMNAQGGKLDEIKLLIGEVRFEQTIIVDRLKHVEERMGHGPDERDS